MWEGEAPFLEAPEHNMKIFHGHYLEAYLSTNQFYIMPMAMVWLTHIKECASALSNKR